MKTKNKIGALVVLGGIALLGVYWFKKNKPTAGTSQAKTLQKISDFYKTGGGKEETFLKGQTAYDPLRTGEISIGGVRSPYYIGLDYRNLTPKQIEDIKKSTSNIGEVQTSSQISNIQNMDFSNINFGNVDWSKVDFSNLK
jgi:hypothetical protein